MFFSERSDFDEVNYKCSARVLTYSKTRQSPSFHYGGDFSYTAI